MHLTNYAINKKNKSFIYNSNIKQDHIGHKRSFSSILNHLRDHNHHDDIQNLLTNIQNIIIKTLSCAQPYFNHSYKTNRPLNENINISFEILGFDIIIDQNLKPFILEVNHTPSFQTDSPLDYSIKKNLIIDVINLLQLNNKLKNTFHKNKNIINKNHK